ncbi:MAG: hypothetical protein AAGA54_34525 [Myxococcota bacterium]
MWLLAPVACGDDSDPGSADASSSTGSGSTTADETTAPGTTTTDPGTSTQSSESASGSSSSGTTDAADSSSSGSLPEEVAFGGTVRDFLGVLGVAGATVTIHGTELSTTADADGAFAFEGLEPDMPLSLVLPPLPETKDAPQYAGAVVPERTGTMDRVDVDAAMIQQAFIENQIAGLDPQDPAEVDLDQAIIVVTVNNDAVASGTVTIELDPPPAAGTFYAPDESGSPILDSAEIGFATLSSAVFFNIPDTDPGDFTVSATHETGLLTCTVPFDSWPTIGQHITLVSVVCE